MLECQYGFRTKQRCEDVDNFSNFVSNKLDCDTDVAGLSIDVSKAFNSLSHDILLSQSHCYGLCGIVHDLLNSYLSDRVQYVSSEQNVSLLRLVTTGIPQGSMLGPIL